MNRVLQLFFMTILACSLVACDSGGANESEDSEEEVSVGTSDDEGFTLDAGSFEATLDDEDEEEPLEISGGAVFGLAANADETDGGTDGENFVVYMLNGERPPEEDRSLTDTWTDIRIVGSDEVPEAGDYEFGSSSADYRFNMDSYALNHLTSGGAGMLTITSVNDDEMEGTFSYVSPGGGAIQVEGAFTAVYTDDIDTVLCTPDCGE